MSAVPLEILCGYNIDLTAFRVDIITQGLFQQLPFMPHFIKLSYPFWLLLNYECIQIKLVRSNRLY